MRIGSRERSRVFWEGWNFYLKCLFRPNDSVEGRCGSGVSAPGSSFLPTGPSGHTVAGPRFPSPPVTVCPGDHYGVRAGPVFPLPSFPRSTRPAGRHGPDGSPVPRRRPPSGRDGSPGTDPVSRVSGPCGRPPGSGIKSRVTFL